MLPFLLQQDVIEEINFEPSVDAANIGVMAADGVVTLSGHVGSYAEKQAAIEAARRVKGVRAIADKIEVRHPWDKKTADDEIAKRALAILAWSSIVPANAIQITVRDGWVTLSGSVDWQYQKKSAEEDIRKLTGVRGITNIVGIRPKVEAEDIQRKIESALKRHAEVEAEAIRVTVKDGNKVMLEGSVRTLEERCAAETAAWSAPGVVLVDDRLTIA